MTTQIKRAKDNEVIDALSLPYRVVDSDLSLVDLQGHSVFVAVENNTIIGMIAECGGGRISHLYLSPSYPDQGLETILLDRMICELKLREEDLIKVHAAANRLPFFLEYGFQAKASETDADDSGLIHLSYKPQEIFDVLDSSGQLTGRYVERGRTLDRGDYHLVVHVWKHNKQGQWLIDRRSFYRGSSMDGKWETTGGAAVAGDDSLQAALRETREELGIELDPGQGCLFHRGIRQREDGHGWIQDVWVFEWNGSLDDISFQESETCDAKWVDFETISRMMADGEFLGEKIYPYFNDLKNCMGNNGIMKANN